MPQLLLIICGSAASWMLEHVVHAKGGLYHRTTKKCLLEPFNLHDTEAFLHAHHIRWPKKQILDLYMAIGGIPFYLKEVQKEMSATLAIDAICFDKKGLLFSEFNHLFQSLFDHSDTCQQIIRAIAKNGNAISRQRLIEETGISSGGSLNKRIEELEASQFIQTFIPLGRSSRDRVYKIIDEYTLFYLKWIEPLIGTYPSPHPWQKWAKSSEKAVWSGYAFESVCFKHLRQVMSALHLDHLNYRCSKWSYTPTKHSKEIGAQIDLLIDRDDDTINVCEIKYRDQPFTIDKAYAHSLISKLNVVETRYPNKKNPSKKLVVLSVIAPYGVKENIYSEDLLHSEVTLDDLFIP